jgi:hypothetical protein
VEVRGLDIGDEAALEPGAEPLVKGWQILRVAIAGEGDLAARAVKLIEGVVELDLGLVLPLEKLDIVEEKNVWAAIAMTELVGTVVTYGRHEVARELLGGDADHWQVGANRLLGYGMQKMGLAEAGATADEEWVVGAAWGAGNSHGRGMGQAVAASDNEGVEGEGGVETGSRPARLDSSG